MYRAMAAYNCEITEQVAFQYATGLTSPPFTLDILTFA